MNLTATAFAEPRSDFRSSPHFAFRDSVEAAAEFGIRYMVQPGGSIRDQEVIEACNEAGIAMLLTGRRHFRH